jgi:hypothetical protein
MEPSPGCEPEIKLWAALCMLHGAGAGRVNSCLLQNLASVQYIITTAWCNVCCTHLLSKFVAMTTEHLYSGDIGSNSSRRTACYDGRLRFYFLSKSW